MPTQLRRLIPRPIQIMKFYFCQSCGRRVTEKDISAGAAANKKLKGVFCEDCAVGVTTMESLPLSDSEARKVLEEDKPNASPKPAAARRPQRRTSKSRIPAPSDRKARPQSESSSRIPPPSIPTAPIMFGVAAIAIVVLAGIWLALSPDRIAASANKPTNRKRVSKPTPKPEFTGKKDPPSLNEEVNGTALNPSEPAKASSVSSRTEARSEVPEKRQVPVPPQQNLDQERTVDGLNAGKTPEDIKKNEGPVSDSDPPDEKATPPIKPTEKPSPPPKPVFDPEVVASSMAHYLPSMGRVLSDGNLEQAADQAREMAEDEKLPAELKIGPSAVSLVEFVRATRKSRLEALKGLIGKDVRVLLPSASRPKMVTVAAVTNETLTLGVEFFINNQKKLRKQTYRLNQLPLKTWSSLVPPPKPVPVEAWVNEAVKRLAVRDAAGTKLLLVKCKSHPFAPYLARGVQKIEMGEREFAAKEAWERAVERLKRKDGQGAIKRFQTYLRDHIETRFFKEHSDMFKRHLRELENQGSCSLTELPHEKPGPPSLLKEPSRKSAPMTLAGFESKPSLWTKPGETIAFNVGAAFNQFEGGVCMYTHTFREPIKFAVIADGRRIWASPEIPAGKSHLYCAHFFNMGIKGVRKLELKATHADVPNPNSCVWVNPRLSRFHLPSELKRYISGPGVPPTPADPSILKPDLIATYFKTKHFTEPVIQFVEKTFLWTHMVRDKFKHEGTVDLAIENKDDKGAVNFSARRTGFVRIPTAGSYQLTFGGNGVSFRARIAGRWIVGHDHFLTVFPRLGQRTGPIEKSAELPAGLLPIRFDFVSHHPHFRFWLKFTGPDAKVLTPEAVHDSRLQDPKLLHSPNE